jgi:hypothetical protein
MRIRNSSDKLIEQFESVRFSIIPEAEESLSDIECEEEKIKGIHSLFELTKTKFNSYTGENLFIWLKQLRYN